MLTLRVRMEIKMRIITGKAKGARLETLDGLATRPTSEKVKEAVFSMIQFETEGRRVLDLFAGSGQLSLEALSRGASEAVLVDSSKQAAEIIRKNAVKTKLFAQVRVITEDYKSAIKKLGGREKFDIVFCDAPYAAKLTGDAISKVMDAGLLSDTGIIICESDEPEPIGHPALKVRRHNRYGRTYITVYDNARDSDNTEEI